MANRDGAETPVCDSKDDDYQEEWRPEWRDWEHGLGDGDGDDKQGWETGCGGVGDDPVKEQEEAAAAKKMTPKQPSFPRRPSI